MAGTITHKWNGTVLTVTSDSGTSSCDLKGSQGDMGVRGPQGAPGVLVDTSGTILAPANNYYLKEEVDDAIAASKKDVSEDITAIQKSVESDILEFENTISAHSKRITNLEHSLAPCFFETDDSIAHIKDVPDTALPYAEINEVGGMSRKCKNLFNLTIKTQTQYGVKLTVNGNGSFTVNGTATADIYFGIGNADLPAGTYTLSGGFKGGSWTKYMLYSSNEASWATGGVGVPFEWEGGACHLNFVVYSGATVSNLTVYPMINEGSSALPFEPHYTGLRDSKVTAIESIGRCLIPASAVYGSFSRTVQRDGRDCFNFNTSASQRIIPIKFKNGTRYTVRMDACSVKAESAANSADWIFAFYYTDGTNSVLSNPSDGVWRTRTFTSDEGKTVKAVGLVVQEYRIDNYVDVNSFRFVEGTEIPADCEPYIKHTFPIPEAVQALEGYGQGVNKDYYNKVVIDPDNFVKKYVKQVKKAVLTGSEGGISISNYSASFTVQQYNIHCAGTKGGLPVCDRLPSTWDTTTGQAEGVACVDDYIVIAIAKSKLTSFGYVEGSSSTYVASFKAYLKSEYDAGNPVTIVHFIKTPTETDISDIVPDDNFIRVYGGGTVTAVNEYEYDVPTKITYQFKEATI